MAKGRVFVVHLRPGHEGPGLIVGEVEPQAAQALRERYENQLWPHLAQARSLGAVVPDPPGGHEVIILGELDPPKAVKAV